MANLRYEQTEIEPRIQQRKTEKVSGQPQFRLYRGIKEHAHRPELQESGQYIHGRQQRRKYHALRMCAHPEGSDLSNDIETHDKRKQLPSLGPKKVATHPIQHPITPSGTCLLTG